MTAPSVTDAASGTSFTGRPGDLRFGPATPVTPPTVDEQLRQAAASHPDAPAVVGDGGTVTYAELDRRASVMARHLRSVGVGTGDRVVVLANRCGWLPVVATGIIRAGAVYVPVDASYPAERVAFILGDCAPAAAIAVGGASLPADVAASGIPVETITDDSPLGVKILGGEDTSQDAATPAFTAEEQSRPTEPSDACYLIYTSGTTGTPKGALNSHLGVAAHFQWMGRMLGEDAGETQPVRMLQKAPVSFDVGVAELLAPLATGGAVVVPSPEWWPGDVDTLVDMIGRHDVTVLSMVPSLMRVLFDVLDDFGTPLSELGNIRHLILGGEAVPGDVVRRARDGIGCRVHGLYGPTETAMDVTWVEYTDELVAAEDFDDHVSLLGLPEDNVGAYVFSEADDDADGLGIEVDPSGDAWDTPGELCISGAQVGNGYFGRPELTDEVFVESPCPEVDGGRMYRTGDIVAWTEVGGQRMLRFLGRIGDQVKIRGNRVELGEVEVRLSGLDGVRQAAAVAVEEHGATRLVAFVVAEDAENAAASDASAFTAGLATALAESVPEYMVPSTITMLDALPVSPNGKLDRKALKAM
ncbi:MAG TPA: amino acid adenylation domain-containing protein [Candidatus Corynebacterium faecigallinarum]|uniref:Amino acid adenylation domain-containing protein n=1 Tax=Candidatus Corynebacterium faecigallinarum TaxID=2838528 RepID=A0A9D2TPQ8_9CORY|nr:amino acid adenylation domain-containing protein [Candidatus Corynebacterium faecigallinarum]